MEDYSIKKIKMQVNHLNNLLDDRTTPQTKMDLEIRALTNMLSNFSYTRSKAPEYEKEALFNELEALKTRLKKYDITGGKLS